MGSELSFLGQCTEFFGSIPRAWWKKYEKTKLIWNTCWFVCKGVPSSRQILLHYMPLYLPNVASGFGIRCSHVPPLARASNWKYCNCANSMPWVKSGMGGRTAWPLRLMKDVAIWLQTFLPRVSMEIMGQVRNGYIGKTRFLTKTWFLLRKPVFF